MNLRTICSVFRTGSFPCGMLHLPGHSMPGCGASSETALQPCVRGPAGAMGAEHNRLQEQPIEKLLAQKARGLVVGPRHGLPEGSGLLRRRTEGYSGGWVC